MTQQNIYKRTVTLRDADKTSWTLTFELRENRCTVKNREDLSDFEQIYELSICGESGQCQSSIKPRTEGQKALLEFWNTYHLNGMSAGTNRQNAYLSSDDYKKAFKRHVDLWSNRHQEFVSSDTYLVSDASRQQLNELVHKLNMSPNQYIMNADGTQIKYGMDDYIVKCMFLALNELYEDRGYKYGTSWLYIQLPDNIIEMVDELLDTIEEEEDELTEELEAVFDMGDKNFRATRHVVNQVMQLRECDYSEALCFIALGRYLECTFGDLNDTFEAIDTHLYRANNREYYIGTYDELEQLTNDMIHNDDEYEYFWREAVAAKNTTKGLDDWLDEIIESDGFSSVLNHYDGTYNEYSVDYKNICVCRT